jgi:glyoxylase I family protein
MTEPATSGNVCDASKRRGADMPEFPTIAHTVLTVSDLGRSVPFYEKLFGAKPVLDEDTGPFRHVVWALGGGQTLVGLHQFADPSNDKVFDERRLGLDHLAFACADRAELEGWDSQLTKLGIEHSPIVDAGYGSGLSFRDPDNIALEFFAPPS